MGVAMVANKMLYLYNTCGLCTSLDLKYIEPGFSPNSIESLCLRVVQMPISRDMVVFVLTTTTRPITFNYPLRSEGF